MHGKPVKHVKQKKMLVFSDRNSESEKIAKKVS